MILREVVVRKFSHKERILLDVFYGFRTRGLCDEATEVFLRNVEIFERYVYTRKATYRKDKDGFELSRTRSRDICLNMVYSFNRFCNMFVHPRTLEREFFLRVVGEMDGFI